MTKISRKITTTAATMRATHAAPARECLCGGGPTDTDPVDGPWDPVPIVGAGGTTGIGPVAVLSAAVWSPVEGACWYGGGVHSGGRPGDISGGGPPDGVLSCGAAVLISVRPSVRSAGCGRPDP
jgi:hypothetical protein